MFTLLLALGFGTALWQTGGQRYDANFLMLVKDEPSLSMSLA